MVEPLKTWKSPRGHLDPSLVIEAVPLPLRLRQRGDSFATRTERGQDDELPRYGVLVDQVSKITPWTSHLLLKGPGKNANSL